MKTRLGIFLIAILALPYLGLMLAGIEWHDLKIRVLLGDPNIVNPPATLLTTLMMAGYLLFINHMNKLITGQQPFKNQTSFLLWVGAAGAVMVWLLSYMNLYAATWANQPGNPVMQALLYTPLFALLVPAVMFTRAFIAALPNVLKMMTTNRTFTPPQATALSYFFFALAGLGLLGGAIWHTQLILLFWIAPLLLLAGLQLLWSESTIFSGLKTGDNARLICAGLSGIIAGNFAMFAYRSNGGLLLIDSQLIQQFGLFLFGLMSMQLVDVITEGWRGKKRSDLYTKKKFPIPIVVKNK